MFKVITPEDWNLAYFALVEICEDDAIRLLRTLDPNAVGGVRGREYGKAWAYRSRIAAARRFRWNGFWKTWKDLNSRVSGRIYLYDILRKEGVNQFLGAYEHQLVICADDDDAAEAVQSLSPGRYLFYVPMLEQGVPEEVGQVMAKKRCRTPHKFPFAFFQKRDE